MVYAHTPRQPPVMSLSFRQTVKMLFRGVNAPRIRRCLDWAKEHEIKDAITTAQLETHWRAGGNIERCLEAVLHAKKLQVPIDWAVIAALDLARKDPIAAIENTAQRRNPNEWGNTTIEDLKGVTQLDKLNATHALILVEADGNADLKTIALP